MNRSFESVLFKIQYIVSTLCNDDILKRKWQSELEWFPKFEETKHIEYWNLAPEAIMSLRWTQLGDVLNKCISCQIYTQWEQRIVDIFTANDTGEDLPEPSDVYPINIPEDYEEEDDAYEAERRKAYDAYMKEELELARQEKAAERHAERRGW
jgi:hypothetical protein